MERLGQGHLHRKPEILSLNVSAGNRTRYFAVGRKHSSKELFDLHINGYSEYLQMSPRHGSPQCMWLHEQT
jgi:hypothetical protein